jgi:hypothetical protein
MSVWLRSCLLSVAAASAPAQDVPPPGRSEAPARQLPPPIAAGSYSEARSRDLFTACDGDGDDRLDLFEASDALDAIAGPKDNEPFLRLDVDRSGFLSWPEFDEHFWQVVERGGTFHVRPCRRAVDQTPERTEARASTPLQRFLRLHDENGNGGLDEPEIERLVAGAGLPPGLASRLRSQDLDRSGRIDETELAPWFELLRGIVPEAALAPAAPAGGLPSPWRTADADTNGRLDEAELAAVLRRLDATLVRWAGVLLQKLDRDKDGVLGADELPAAGPAGRRPGAATSGRPRPPQPASPSQPLSQAPGQ